MNHILKIIFPIVISSITVLSIFSISFIVNAEAEYSNTFSVMPEEQISTAVLDDRIKIDSFSDTGELVSSFSFAIRSTDQFRVFLLLPPGQIWSHELVSTLDSEGYYYSYIEPMLNASCYSQGILFPFDTYELWFIFCFDVDLDLSLENPENSAYFGNTAFYDDWSITRYSLTKLELVDNSTWIDYIAPGKKDLNILAENYELKSVYALKTQIMREGTNFIRSIILWIPPGIIPFLLIGYLRLPNESDYKKSKHSVRLYTGIAFFLAGYLIALQETASPDLTFIEIAIVYEITGSLLFLLLDMHDFKIRWFFLGSVLWISVGIALIIITGDWWVAPFFIIPGIIFLIIAIWDIHRGKEV